MNFSARHLAALFVVLGCAAAMCLYWSRVTDAVHASPATSNVLKPKVLTDFYPSWFATREFLLHHRDPYGAGVNRDLQIAYYGKELNPSIPQERVDQQRFVYPLYFIFFVAPTAWLEVHAAKILVWCFLAICAMLNLVVWLRFVRPRLSPVASVVLFVLVLSSIPVLQNLSILQPFLFPACFIAGAAVAVASEQLLLAGVLLAMATIKPQICLLPLAWFSLWMVSDWKRRRSLLWGFSATLVALIAASEWLLPGWLMRYPHLLRDYAHYTDATYFLRTLIPPPWHWIVASLAIILVAQFCWRVRKRPASSAEFAVALSLVLALAALIVPAMVQPFNHVLLLPAVLLAIRYWHELRLRNAITRSATSIFCFCISLPWLFAIVAVANPFDRSRDWLLRVWSLPLIASMTLPFTAFGVLILLRGIVTLPATPGAPSQFGSATSSPRSS